MKKAIYIFLTLTIMLTVSSCNQNSLDVTYTTKPKTTALIVTNALGDVQTTSEPTVKNESKEIFDNTTPYEKLITKEDDINEIVQNYFLNNRHDVFGFYKTSLGIECLRKTVPDGNKLVSAYYSVHKIKQGGLLYIFYDINPETQEALNEISWSYVNGSHSYSDFQSIKNGDTIDDVIKIDKATQIDKNMYRILKDSPNISDVFGTTHYLSDGIFILGYKNEDGKLIVNNSYYCDDYSELYCVASSGINKHISFRVQDIDRVK